MRITGALRLVAALLVVHVAACTQPEPPPATPRSVAARLADAPVTSEVRTALEGLHAERGPRLARLDAGDPEALEAWGVRVRAGRVVPADGALGIEPVGGDKLTRIHLTPPVRLPPSFRAEVTLAKPGSATALPARLLWESERFPDFNLWRHAPREVLDAGGRGASRAAYEIVQWSGPIRELRFDLVRRRDPVEIREIAFYAPPARNVLLDDGGRLWADLDSVALTSLWAPVPSVLSSRHTVPDAGLLRVSLGNTTTPGAGEIRFRIGLEGADEPLLEATRAACADCTSWQPVEVDLARWAGQEVTLRFEVAPADGEAPGEVAALWGAPTLHGRGAAVQPPIVMVTWDTTRQSQLSVYGNVAPNTPFLDELSASAAVFERAFSQAPWTVPSMASLLTSRSPWQLGVAWGKSHRVPDDARTLAEILGDAGFVTGAFVGNFVLGPKAGYAQGFDHYHFARHDMTDGAEITAAALAWAASRRDEPILLFVHYVDPHAPYRPGKRALGQLFPDRDPDTLVEAKYPPSDPEEAEVLLRRYEGEILRTDRHLRRLVEGVREAWGREPVLALTSDHGEEFLEHGFYGHGGNLFATQTHVPLVVAGPGVPTARIEASVRNLDVVPTLLELAGVEAPAELEGTSLLPLARGESLPLVAYSESNAHGPRRAAVRDDRFTYVTFESWDPLSPRHPGTSAIVERHLEQFLTDRALYEGVGADEPDVAERHPEVVRRMQRIIDSVEVRRHRGIGVRLRGPRDGNTTVTLAGWIRVDRGTIESARTRQADRGGDTFELAEDRRALRFETSLPPGDEDWILVELSAPDAEVSIELDPAPGLDYAALLGDRPAETGVPLRVAGAAPNAATLLEAFDRTDGAAVVQVWRSEERPAAAAAALDDDEIARLRALGYMQ
ncbi:MAG: sulfatase [Myxococcota bacterium]|nr:sulfatase [Myxococcota bacterium]